MDLTSLSSVASLADHLTSLGLVVMWLVAGYRGVWYFGNVVKDRDLRIKTLEQKLETQERLIDRLSGLAERSADLARPVVMHEIQERRRGRTSDG